MAKVVIDGLDRRYDGEYEVEPENLTMRDLHLIKEVSGVRVTEIGEAFQKIDSDLVLAFAMIGLRNAGKPVPLDFLLDAPVGKISLDFSEEDEEDEEDEKDEGDEAGPPALPKTGPEPPSSASAPSEPSGEPSEAKTDGDDSQVIDLRATGQLG